MQGETYNPLVSAEKKRHLGFKESDDFIGPLISTPFQRLEGELLLAVCGPRYPW